MLIGRRYRLALTPAQLAKAERTGDICRFVWNCALEQRRHYRQRGAWMNYGDLKVANMTASARGTMEEPGSRVRQKTGLNRAILC